MEDRWRIGGGGNSAVSPRRELIFKPVNRVLFTRAGDVAFVGAVTTGEPLLDSRAALPWEEVGGDGKTQRCSS